jgi:hypothetical protein
MTIARRVAEEMGCVPGTSVRIMTAKMPMENLAFDKTQQNPHFSI